MKRKIFYQLKERLLAKSNDYRNTMRANWLGRAIEENPKDKKISPELAALYIQEARITGDYMCIMIWRQWICK